MMARTATRWRRIALAVIAGAGGLGAAAAAWNASDARSLDEREALAAQGAALYAAHCAECHGDGLEGAEPGAAPGAALAAPPLVKPGFRFFFTVLPVGMEGFIRDEITSGENLMPSFAGRLSENEIAALAHFVRAKNHGTD